MAKGVSSLYIQTLGLLIAGTIASIIGIKYAAQHPSYLPLIVLVVGVFYLLSIGLLYQLFQQQKVGIVFSLSNAIPVALVAILSVFIFNESLSWKQIIGIVLIVIGAIAVS